MSEKTRRGLKHPIFRGGKKSNAIPIETREMLTNIYGNESVSCGSVSEWDKIFLAAEHKYEGWNFNFGNTLLDWIQELLE